MSLTVSRKEYNDPKRRPKDKKYVCNQKNNLNSEFNRLAVSS